MGWVLTTRIEYRAAESGCYYAELLEIQASEVTRERWTAAFWALFPASEEAFTAWVRGRGIGVSIDFDFKPTRVAAAKYGGVPLSELDRYVRRDLERGPLPTDQLSYARFKPDKQQWDHDWRAAVEEHETRLPGPPFGFSWRPDRGGVFLSRNVGGWEIPLRLQYRLWRDDLGYMLSSE
jgi:hypothetical protein